MSIVSVDFAARKAAPVTRHHAFCLARQEMVKALQAWIESGPDQSDIHEEIDGTMNAIGALVALQKLERA
jgi:hypothetical protein